MAEPTGEPHEAGGRPYTGRILRVDVDAGACSVEEQSEVFYRRYLGGWGIIGYYLLHEVPPGADALGPDNRLIFAAGVVTGLPIAGSARNAVGAKSPLTGGFGASEVGGFWPGELKRAGFDAIIIQGRSQRPVYLWVHDGVAELRDAAAVWGLEIREAEARLKQELGDQRIRTALIGPAGENTVRYACIMNDLRYAAGRTGMGAVMGSKRLKAVVVRGSSRLGMADAATVSSMAKHMGSHVDELDKSGFHIMGTGAIMPQMVKTGNLPVHNFRDGDFPVDRISAETIKNSIGQGLEGCPACAVRCKKVVKVGEPYNVDPTYGGPEYETLAALGSNCDVDDVKLISQANQMCSAYGLDTISAGVTIAFAMECFERGLISLKDTGGVNLQFGNGQAMLTMLDQIAHRQGFGALLAEGTKRVAAKIGQGSEAFAMEIKGQEYPMHDPRFKKALGVTYAISPTGAEHNAGFHDPGLSVDGGAMHTKMKELGVLEAIPLDNQGPSKMRAGFYHILDHLAQNCATMCSFVPWTYGQHSEIVRAATGWTFSFFEWLKAGERALNMARLFDAREGFTAADDRVPQRSFEPPTNGVLAEKGVALQRDQVEQGIRYMYAIAGWDPVTGWPTPGKLWELDLGWAVDYLPTKGVQHAGH